MYRIQASSAGDNEPGKVGSAGVPMPGCDGLPLRDDRDATKSTRRLARLDLSAGRAGASVAGGVQHVERRGRRKPVVEMVDLHLRLLLHAHDSLLPGRLLPQAAALPAVPTVLRLRRLLPQAAALPALQAVLRLRRLLPEADSAAVPAPRGELWRVGLQ